MLKGLRAKGKGLPVIAEADAKGCHRNNGTIRGDDGVIAGGCRGRTGGAV